VPLFKIASGEITNHPFLAHVARKEKPIILSTGMSTLDEVAAAIDVLKKAGCERPALLHCVSSYPAVPEDANLRALDTLREAFGGRVGFSDHTPGLLVSVCAAARGAAIIEKHFTLDKSLPGPDHRMSLSPAELKELSSALRLAARSLGDGVKRPKPAEEGIRQVARRSLVLRCAAPAGAVLSEGMLIAKRPASGISPADLSKVIGRRLKAALPEDAILTWDALSDEG
jgi:N,N'-diacetyllegionaminate synthase